MAAWAATAIRQAHPDAFLCWAVESRCAAVVDRKDLVTRAWEFPRDRWKKKRWSPNTWREQIAAYARLRRFKFDFGLDLQGHSKTALCLRLAAPKKRLAARATDKMAARLNPVFGARPEGIHTVEWNHRVLQGLGEFEMPIRPIMPLREDAWDTVRPLLPLGRPLASIAVSAGQPDKAYPVAQWRAVAERLVREGYTVAFIGGPSDPCIEVPDTIDLVGKLPLEQTMEVVAHSHLHLAGDTGTGHMAAAMSVPVVSIFGPTDPREFRPYTELGTVLRTDRTTAAIQPEEVVEAAQELMRRVRAGLPH